MTQSAAFVIGGVDTHGRSHHAAVVDEAGRILGSAEFVASTCRRTLKHVASCTTKRVAQRAGESLHLIMG